MFIFFTIPGSVVVFLVVLILAVFAKGFNVLVDIAVFLSDSFMWIVAIILLISIIVGVIIYYCIKSDKESTLFSIVNLVICCFSQICASIPLILCLYGFIVPYLESYAEKFDLIDAIFTFFEIVFGVMIYILMICGSSLISLGYIGDGNCSRGGGETFVATIILLIGTIVIALMAFGWTTIMYRHGTDSVISIFMSYIH